MKKILLFSHEYPPAIGGAGSVAQNIFNTAKKLNVDIDILSLHWLRSSNLPRFVKKTILQLWPMTYAPFLLFHANRYDLIICNDGASIYCAGLYLSNKNLKKVKCIIHGVEPLLQKNNRKANFINFKAKYSKCLAHCKEIFFVSEYIKGRFSKDIDTNGILDKIKVSHNGIDKNLFHPVSTEKHKNQIRIVSVSRIVEGKGYKKSFEAVLYLKKSNPNIDIKWTIVGDGAYLNNLKRQVSESAINEDVIFLGQVEQSKLPLIYSNNNIFLLLTELEEAFGLAYLEAANCGCYVIGSDIGGVPEAFKHITHGKLIDTSATTHEISEAILSAEYLMKHLPTNKCLRSIDDFFHEITNE